MRSRDPTNWMWTEALGLLQDAERLQRQFFRIATHHGTPRWEPPVDLYENGDELWIYFALPGVPEDHLDIGFEGSVLVIRGDRPLPAASQGAAIHRLEIPYGRFERRVALPFGRYQIMQKVMEHGCLVVGMRRLGE